MLPQNYDVIKSFEIIEEEFGSTNSGTIMLEVDNSYINANEHSSVVNREVILYSLKLENYLSYIEDVKSVSGIGNIIEQNYNQIPQDIEEIKIISKSIIGKNYVSKDESIALIKISFDENVDSKTTTKEIQELINQIKKPAGIKVSLVEGIFEEVIINEQMGPDMNRTSMFSIIAIVLILTLLFRSIKGVALPLMTIIFGIFWTLGFLGLINSGLSSMTSGAISMIMGIGIDFGIQVMNRFKQELKENNKRKAMENTLNGILTPIFTTTLACLIGFKAMGLGELSMMAELGNVMSYGVMFCMFASITIVPSLLIIFTKEKTIKKKK
jgi:predicted RND superfamily exporter protein